MLTILKLYFSVQTQNLHLDFFRINKYKLQLKVLWVNYTALSLYFHKENYINYSFVI